MWHRRKKLGITIFSIAHIVIGVLLLWSIVWINTRDPYPPQYWYIIGIIPYSIFFIVSPILMWKGLKLGWLLITWFYSFIALRLILGLLEPLDSCVVPGFVFIIFICCLILCYLSTRNVTEYMNIKPKSKLYLLGFSLLGAFIAAIVCSLIT